MATRDNHQILLAERPSGKLAEKHFRGVDSTIDSPTPGQVLCRPILLSIDPANRLWLRGSDYLEVREGEVMPGWTLDEVIEENQTSIEVGTIVTCESGWQEYAIHPIDDVRAIEPSGDLTKHMSVLGMTGRTAYFGLLNIGRPQSGETVVVSAAAGATGNVVGQIAKLHGCRVIGITGSDRKNRMLTDDLNFDAAVSYKDPSFASDLRAACPDGIDVYFDNVGGEVLSTVLPIMNLRGRIVCCGAVSQYDSKRLPIGAPINTSLLVGRRLRMHGFVVMDYDNEAPQAEAQLAEWIANGELKILQDVIEGLDSAPRALVGLLAGDNVGKRMVRVRPDPP